MLALAQQNQLLNEEDLSDWGSDFDDDYEDEVDQCQSQGVVQDSANHVNGNGSLNTSHSSVSSVTTVEHQYLISSNGSLSSGCSSSTSTSVGSDTKDENRSGNGSIGSFGSSGNGTGSSATDDADDLYEIPDGKPSVLIATAVTVNVNAKINARHLPIERNANWAKLKAQLEKQFDENTNPKRPATVTAMTTTMTMNKPKPPTKPKPKVLLHSQSLPKPDTATATAFTASAAVNLPPSPGAGAVPTPFALCPQTPPPPAAAVQSATPAQTPKPQPPQPQQHIEQVLLPTRATKEEDSRNFIESLKRKLSQKNHLVSSLISSASHHHSHNNKEDSKSSKNKKNQNQNQSTSSPATATNDGAPANAIANASPLSRKDSNISMTKASYNRGNLSSVNESQLPNAADDPELIKKLCDAVQKFPWFYRVDRHKAELILENYNLDGSFLVRECQHGGPNVPFTLTIRFGQRCFHIQIRLRPEDCNFALGTTKMHERHFGTVQELIDTYRKSPLQLHTNGKYFGETKLTQPPIVYSFSK